MKDSERPFYHENQKVNEIQQPANQSKVPTTPPRNISRNIAI